MDRLISQEIHYRPFSFNLIKDKATTAASVGHRCYILTATMYYLKQDSPDPVHHL